VSIIVSVITYFLDTSARDSSHFDLIPGAVSIGVVALLIWLHHRHRMDQWWKESQADADREPSRDKTTAAYQYIMTAIGLSFALGSLTALVAVAFGSDIAGTQRSAAAVSLGIAALISVGVWLGFWSVCQAMDRPVESLIQPRRAYLVGMSIIVGLTAAQAIIASLVVLFQSLLGLDPSQMTLVTEGTLALLATGSTLHLVRANRADRALHQSDEVVLPFEVTIICSHPGQLAGRFPKEAKTRVIYRDDQLGVVTDEMASEIVAAVGTRSSIVWVGEGSFEVAPTR
jgi:hypothetical protein